MPGAHPGPFEGESQPFLGDSQVVHGRAVGRGVGDGRQDQDPPRVLHQIGRDHDRALLAVVETVPGAGAHAQVAAGGDLRQQREGLLTGADRSQVPGGQLPQFLPGVAIEVGRRLAGVQEPTRCRIDQQLDDIAARDAVTIRQRVRPIVHDGFPANGSQWERRRSPFHPAVATPAV